MCSAEEEEEKKAEEEEEEEEGHWKTLKGDTFC